MAPFIEQTMDISMSSHNDDLFTKTSMAPLHETTPMAGRKRVRFHPMTEIYDVMNRDDYTDDEFLATWLDREDMKRIKQDARFHAKLLEMGTVAPKQHEIRGLENRTREMVARKKQTRLNVYGAVFFELQQQYINNVFSETLIAHAYSVYSKPAARMAQTVGREDELVAKAIYSENGQSADCLVGSNFPKTVAEFASAA